MRSRVEFFTGPRGRARVVTVSDSPLQSPRHTVCVMDGDTPGPVAAFVRDLHPRTVQIGHAKAYRGTFADAVAYARQLVNPIVEPTL